jgi:type VI protein secretion system component Hcp
LVRGEKQTLIQMIDDASNRLLYAQLWEGETISKTHLTWGKLINATRC